MTAVRAFDVCGPLPSGVTVLEASAGTGKTYAIAALAARYVADGVPLDELLLVTFTRMATGELRERVRERLVSAEQALDHALAGALPQDADEVVRLLAAGPSAEVARRRERLSRALAAFDAATIATTHGFCQEVLTGLGAAGDVEHDCELVEDVDDLLEEVVDDLYVRRFRSHDPLLTREEALRIARAAVADPLAPVEPRLAPDTSVVATRRRLALAVRAELDVRKRRQGVITYDDLLTRLDRTLSAPGGDAVAERLRARYRVVLVDEFQDTDPTQWDIMRRAFAAGGGTLVLIGDPKQAIYAFRGADVYAYLQAARTAGEQATLEVNWRSDQGLIDAYDALFGGAQLGHEGIVYRRVRAADANRAARLDGAPAGAPLRVRIVDRAAPTVGTTPRGFARLDGARRHIARDLAGELVALLRSKATIECRADTGAVLGHEPVRPRHVAVLVRTHRNAAIVRDALEAAGVPAVINGAGSVFGTEPARDWLRLLEALERPASAGRAHAAALTPFLGWTAEDVATAGDDAWEDVHRRLHDWARVLRVRGAASLAETITLTEGLPERVLATADGERRLTDLRHVAQLLHAAATGEHLGTTALTGWLRRRIAAAQEETSDEERSRRLESDAEAVQVLTIHRAKGLEFPIVLHPDLFEPSWIPSDPVPVVFHDPAEGDRRTVDVALEGSAYRDHCRQHLREQRGEDLRLLYVALTRARHQSVVWWAGSFDSRNAALTRLLFRRDASGAVAPLGDDTPSDAAVRARLQELAAQAPGCISVEDAAWGPPAAWSAAAPAAGALDARDFARRLDFHWRRTSYSAITAAAHEARVGSEPEEAALVDEPAEDAPAPAPAPGAAPPATEAALRAAPSPLAGLPVGLDIGTFVHRVLETADFAAGDLDAELREHVAAARTRRASLDVGDPAAAVAGLRGAIETPLGPLLGGDVRLRDVARADRLDELTFELPLAGGDQPRGRLTPTAIGALLRDHLPAGDPVAAYAERLGDPALARELRGYLTGSIDLVLRVRDASGAQRFAIADYKTNWLAPPGEELSAWHHRSAALIAEMERHHYLLQALLYTTALHRYLRWRIRGYRAERSLAGVLYLFVRGMSGAGTPVVDGMPCGVFSWCPPAALVEALSDLLDTGDGR